MAGVAPASLRNVFVWGNHSTTQVPDARFVTVAQSDGTFATASSLGLDAAWVTTTLVPLVQNRGKAVIDARGASSAASAACAIVDHLRDWICGSAGRAVSMAVCSDSNPYEIAPGLVFSFPVVCEVRSMACTVRMSHDPSKWRGSLIVYRLAEWWSLAVRGGTRY